MNKDKHDKLYPLIVARDGEYCKGCNKIKSEIKEDYFLIDHKDNNNCHNNLDNLQLLCRSCNYWKNPKSEIADLDEHEASGEFKKNEIMEKEFRRWVFGIVSEEGKMLLSDAIESGAEIIGSQIISTQRYIKKMKSKAGLYEIVQLQDSLKYLRFKPEYR